MPKYGMGREIPNAGKINAAATSGRIADVLRRSRQKAEF
jgi:hypothetical protein